MARRCFFSFHYKPDNWRASQVRNMGKIEGSKAVSDNDWETVTKGGNKKIKEWIKDQMSGRSCTVVLIGANTSGRKWITHEIVESWNDGMGVFGVHIHNLKNSTGKQSSKGSNPFYSITAGKDKKRLSTIVETYDPPYLSSTYVYDHIEKNIADWADEAVKIRKDFKG